MSTLNILVSSTRQWNPGDEFILFGVQNLIREAFRGDINWIIYDRNPDRWINEWKLPLLKSADWSNVFRHYTLEGFDIAVIAGSPEWYGDPLKRFYSLVREYNIPLLVLGVGYNFGTPTAQFDLESGEAVIDFSDDEIYCLRHLAQLITTRDDYASRALSRVGISHYVLPCPALFAADQGSPINEIRRVAFILQSAEGVQKISGQIVHGALTAISELRAKGLEVEIICHYIDEFMEFLPVLSPIRYSYDAREYLDILGSFDVVVSTRRLHGAILGNSLGKPAVLISNGDIRCRSGAKHFPFIYVVHAKDVVGTVERISVGEISKHLIDWKLESKESYLRFLRPVTEKILQHFNRGVSPSPAGDISYIARPTKEKPQPELSLAQFKDNLPSLVETLKSKASQICTNRPVFEQERVALELTLQAKDAQIAELNNVLQTSVSQINSLETSLQEKVSQIKSLETSLQEKVSQIKSLETSLQEKVSQIKSLETSLQEKVSQINSLEVQMQQIHRGIVVQLLSRYQRVVEKLLRPGTRPRYYYELGLTGIRVILNEGWHSFFSAVRRRLRLIRAVTKTAALHLPEFNLSISRKEAEKLTLPEPSQKPAVSMIIPAYNKWQYTVNCLKSICQNTDGDYEVIVVDDASSDDTAKILSKVKNLVMLRNKKNAGFIESCNRGAKASKGDYILFLNNDTMVTKGWLLPLLEIIRRDNVGAVGSKLVYPDGTLQEAGGIIWNDGSGWNYGRGDDPEKPEYNYVREVDYCSGASLMVKRGLFEKIGGFDERFKPAYCEDGDLCFSLRKIRYKAMYQPMSVVVHFEGVTCGTDTSSGIKRYQEINRPKFVKKWNQVLQKYHYPPVAENAFLARDRVSGKRILVIDHYVPTYDQDAGSESTFNILTLLSELGHKVTFIGDNLLNIQPYTTALQQNGIEVIYGPFFFSVEEYIKRNGKYFDIVILSRPHIAIKHLNSVKENCNRAKVIYDTKDLVYMREFRRAEIENNKKVLKLAEASKKTEFYLAENSDLTLVVSPEEKKILLKEDPKLNVEVLRHVLPIIEQPKKSFSEKKDLLYVGGFNHIPNIDGVIYFVNEIFPEVKKRLPGVRLYVVGSNPPHEVLSLKSRDIIVTGFVKDLEPYFENCRVFVVPLRYGAGIKAKVIHSMIRGVPVVATPIGAEGIIEEVEEGKDILVADTREDFIEKVVSLYTDEKLWNILSESPLHYVEKNYSYEASRAKLKEILGKLCI